MKEFFKRLVIATKEEPRIAIVLFIGLCGFINYTIQFIIYILK